MRPSPLPRPRTPMERTAICMTPRRRWRSRSSCWPSARSSPGTSGLPHALGGSNRFEQFLEPALGHVASDQEIAAADDHAAESTELDIDGRFVGRRVERHRDRGILLPEAAGCGRDSWRRGSPACARCCVNKYYVDEIYDAVIVQPIRIVSENGLWKIVDARVIDGAVNGVAGIVAGTSALMRRVQTGSVRAYAASLFLGVVLILGFYLW